METLKTLIGSVSLPPQLEREKIMPVISIAAATALTYSTYKAVHHINKKKNLKQDIKYIPSPGSSYPYVGHMFALGNSPGKQIAEWHKEMGHIFKLRMGIQTWILIDDPTLANKVFVTNGISSSNRPLATFGYEYFSFKGKGIGFAQPQKNWKNARAAVSSIISPKIVDTTYMSPIKAEAVDLVDSLIKYSKMENGINPNKHLHLNSLNTILMVAFGKKYSSVEDPEFILVSGMIEKTMGLASTENDLPNFLPIMKIVEYFSGRQAIMKNFIDNVRNVTVSRLINEALEREGPNFVKSLDEFNIVGLDRIVTMNDLINGGTDTVSVTISWMLAILCNYPLVQKNVCDEIDKFVKSNGHIPEFSERTDIPYCVSVMKECMRFKPTTPFGIPHVTTKDVVVDGYLIPKGATVITSMESIHQNSEVYPEPLRFYPERFLDNLKTMDAASKGVTKERDHFNFGWGRRICPAIYMAEVELFAAFIQIFSRCNIEPVRDSNGKEQFPDIENVITSGLTILPYPYKINFVERTNSFV